MSTYAERRDGKVTGMFYAEVRLPKGKTLPDGSARYRERWPSLKEAQGAEAYVKATGTTPPWSDSGRQVGGASFRDAALACKEAGGPSGKWKRQRDKSGQGRIEYVMGFLGPLPVAGITTENLDALVEDLIDRPGRNGTMLGSTVNRYLSAASAVLTFARSRPKLYPGVEEFDVPWQPESEGRIVWFTEAQEAAVCRALVDMGMPNVALSVRVLAATGVRVGELLRLEAADVEDVWVRLWQTKTDRPRSVPIDADVYPGLTRDLRTMIRSGSVPNYMQIFRNLKAAVGKCGYPADLNVHALRHTFATRLISKGVSPAFVQKLLGHKRLETTMRYSHVRDEDLLGAVKKLAPTAWESGEQSVVLPLQSPKIA